jgi:lipopolysaccharide/colanic/teichoic acid biosynthesis glycosyltransferase
MSVASSTLVASVAPSALAPPRAALAGLPTAQPGKRAFDVLLAVVLLVALLPVLLCAALAVKLSDGGPVLFRQRRVGRGGRQFSILKLRTMIVGADDLVPVLTDRNARTGLLFKIVDDPRVTRVGRVLRRFALDEIPQLWNVVRGDMSIVGPRPLPVDPACFDWHDGIRHRVRPGITGRWQVHGGDTYDQMVAHDLAYIRDWTLASDAVLLVRTVPTVLRRRIAC